ncbi:PaaX family transcriptional regulator C-terminal domain-containing protein [Embleya sp. NPDC020886]|uniref:PaaX family transcriptional regulator n=1 Tax=Embleya sp. NPDC020886 TaxID=3363980 RepID=UPI00379C565F
MSYLEDREETRGTPAGRTGPRTRRTADGGPSARTLLLTVLGEYVRWPGHDGVWSPTAVAALDALGVPEAATRRAITRLTGEGWLVARAEGRYTRLTLAPSLYRLLTGWTERLARATRETPWSGQWQQLLFRPPATLREARAVVEEQLAFEGFGDLGRGVWIAADPGGVGALRALIAEQGLAGHATWMTSSVSDPERERALVEQAWDPAAIRVVLEAFVDRFAGARANTDAEAFELRTRLVHAWRLTFECDPRLPAALLPADWPGAAASDLFVATWHQVHEPAQRWWAHLDRDPRRG